MNKRLTKAQIYIAIAHLTSSKVVLKKMKSRSGQIRMSALIEIAAMEAVIEHLEKLVKEKENG